MRKNLLSRAALAVLCLGLSSNVMADNINVNDAASLKSAVSSAKNGDVIILAAGTYNLDSEIDVNNKNLTFVGVGKVVLDGQKKVRVMNVHNKANAVVENLIIQNGYVSDSGNNKGAGIRLDGGSLTVTNCKFIDNKVDYNSNPSNPNWTGGAGIHTNEATLTVTNSEFKGGEAYQGGAITVQNSNITADNVLFEGNRTMYGVREPSAKGAAICFRSDKDIVCTQNFNYCVFKENISWGNGGALSFNVGGGAKGQNTVFRGCSFVGNTTHLELNELAYEGLDYTKGLNDGLNGGAIYFEGDGNVTMDFLSCTFTKNWATSNGGAACFQAFKAKENNELRFVNCTITDNHNLGNCGNGAGLTLNAVNTCKGVKIYNTILTGNWSIKVKDGNGDANDGSDYIADTKSGNSWKHWEYSDLSTGNEADQKLFEIKNTVIGYLNNGNNYDETKVYNTKINHLNSQAWVDGETEKDQLGELAEFDEEYFAYPLDISAMDWTEMGDPELAAEFGCTTDQFGVEWGADDDCYPESIGAVQYDDITCYEDYKPTFFSENYVPTGIENIKTETVTGAENNAWYTVSGVRVAKPTAKGIYIHNGKKVVK